jgi:hypothetical protein
MSEDLIDGVLLEEGGEKVILTTIEPIEETGRENFIVSKLDKRGKSYFSLVVA